MRLGLVMGGVDCVCDGECFWGCVWGIWGCDCDCWSGGGFGGGGRLGVLGIVLLYGLCRFGDVKLVCIGIVVVCCILGCWLKFCGGMLGLVMLGINWLCGGGKVGVNGWFW